MAKAMTKTTQPVSTDKPEVETKKATTTKTISEVQSEVEYSPESEIPCVSVTAGELIMIGRKTRNIYRWMDYGDTQTVEYQDLKAEKYNKLSRYIYDPLFMIADENLLSTPDFVGVLDVYQNILSTEDIDAIFSSDTTTFRRILTTLPVGLKNTVKSLAVSKIQDGTFDSVQKIRIMDEVLGTDLFNGYLSGD